MSDLSKDTSLSSVEKNLIFLKYTDLEKATKNRSLILVGRTFCLYEKTKNSDLTKLKDILETITTIFNNIGEEDFSSICKEYPLFLKNLQFIKNKFQKRQLPRDIKAAVLQFFPLPPTPNHKKIVQECPHSFNLSKNETIIYFLNRCERKGKCLLKQLGLTSEKEIVRFLRACQTTRTRLTKLDFTGIRMTDQMIQEIIPLNHLNNLILGDCSKLSSIKYLLFLTLEKVNQKNPSQAEAILNQLFLNPAKKIQCAEKRAEVLLKIGTEQVKSGLKKADITFTLALQAVKNLQYPQRKINAFIAIAVQQAKIDPKAAKKTFTLAIDIANGIRNSHDKELSFRRIAEKQAQSKCFNEALQITKRIQNVLIKESTFQIIAEKQAQSGDFNKALNTASMIQRIETKLDILTKIATEQAKSDTNKAKKIIAIAAQIAKEIKDLDERESSLETLATGQARCKDFVGALNTARSIRGVMFRDSALSSIAIEQAKCGDIKSGLNTAKEINDVDEKKYTFQEIESKQTKNCSIEDNLETVAIQQARNNNVVKALTTAEKINPLSCRENSYFKILDSLRKIKT